MSKLKQLSHPLFRLKVPSLKKEFQFRPWLSKEDKILLLAMAGNDDIDLLTAAKQIVTNCCTTELPELASFDWEYLFIQLRATSIGESVVVYYENPKSECEVCKKKRAFQIKLREVEVNFHKDHSNKIQLADDLWIIMKYPDTDKLKINTGSVEEMFTFIAEHVSQIVQGDTIISKTDMTIEETKNFIEHLTREQFNKIDFFFDTIPALQYKVDLSCEKCGRKNFDIIRGMSNFFV